MLRIQKEKFSLPAASTYLNCAYMSPLLKSVEGTGIKALLRKRNPASISADDFFSDGLKLREEFARLINAPVANRVVPIPSVSYGMANVSKNVSLNRGDEVLVAAEQFPSNYYPWQRLTQAAGATIVAVTPPESLNQRGKEWNTRLLEAINKSTRLVALGNVHWADGTRFDLAAVRQRATEVGALLIIDGTQSVGALPFDVQRIKPDALICAGYKWLLGPYSIGMAYYGEAFDNGTPIEESWINRKNSENFAALVNYEDDYQPGSLRYAVGENSNFVLAPMLLEALKQINRWTPSAIQEYCAKIAAPSIDKLRERGFWIEDAAYRGHHLFGIRLPKGMDVTKTKDDLARKKISVSVRGSSIRVAPHVYNSAEDFDRLVRAFDTKR